jgi:hypothetical protein
MTRRLDLSAIVLSDRHPVRDFLDDVVEVESFDARTVWLYDHLTWPRFADRPWHATVPLLAAAAAATSSVRLGTQVASPNFRHPVTFAKELMTLDHLSAGRIEAGLGAGTTGPDAVVLGNAPLIGSRRVARFAEWLGLLDRLLREPVTTAYGEWYTAVDAHQLPGCVQAPRIPFTVAATGPKGLGLVARYGQAWVTYGPTDPNASSAEWFGAVRTQSRTLDDALGKLGRDRGEVRRIAQFVLDARWPFESADRYRDTVGRLEEYGFDAAGVHAPELAAKVGMQIPVEPMRRHEHYIETSAGLDHLPFFKDVHGLAVHAYRQGISVGLVDFDHPGGEDFTIDPTDYPERVRPALAERFNGLGELTLRDSWTGLYDQNRFDGNMIIGNWPGHADNFLVACGFSGHGFMHALGVGRGLTELVLHGQYRTLDLSRLGYQRILDERPYGEEGVR